MTPCTCVDWTAQERAASTPIGCDICAGERPFGGTLPPGRPVPAVHARVVFQNGSNAVLPTSTLIVYAADVAALPPHLATAPVIDADVAAIAGAGPVRLGEALRRGVRAVYAQRDSGKYHRADILGASA